jgi:hypothetical protein
VVSRCIRHHERSRSVTICHGVSRADGGSSAMIIVDEGDEEAGVGVAEQRGDIRVEEVRGEPTTLRKTPRRAALTPSIQHSIPE